jgi:tetrahydromethanopterin S-methyltransferase subunit C
VLITAAPRSRSEEARARRARYLWTMGIRAGCFVVAVAVAQPVVRVAAIVGACVLPYIAVVGANTVRRVAPDRNPSYYIPGPRNEIHAGVGGREPPPPP